MMELTVLAIPVFLVTMLVEAFVLAKRGHGYERNDTLASLSGGLGSLAVKALIKGVWFAVFGFLYAHRFFTLEFGLGTALLLFVAEDFCYYAYHRTSHEVRFFWAAHVVHHSSERYTLSTALRQSWTAPLVNAFFWFPLPLLGFRPEWIAVASSVSLLYQYWIHTETITKLGPLEWVFNTPSHHRVHHGSNVQYLDRNHGGILIIWDRLFGSFEPEVEPVRYGLTKRVESYDPWFIQVHEFRAIWSDLRKARSLRDAWAAVTAMPRVARPA